MWIKSYILTIVTIVIFLSVVESIMPDTDMKKHISLVAGLIVLLTIARPVISITKISYNDLVLNTDVALQASNNLNKKIDSHHAGMAKKDFAYKTSQIITQSINTHFNTSYIAQAVIYNDSDIKIKLNCTANEAIRNYVKTNYGFDCIFEKGGI